MNAVVLVHAPRPAGLVLSPRDDVGLAAKPVRRLLDRLERLQDVLGESQDAVTQIAWLRADARSPGVHGGSVLPAGALIRALAQREAQRRRQGLKLWRKLERSGLLDEVITALAELARDGSPTREAKSA